MQNVLIVEDSAETFALVERALGQMVKLCWVKTLGEASKIVIKESFDMVLLDVTLPDGEGYRFCSILQSDDQLRKLPIIFLTAKSSLVDKLLGFTVGADDYITKPFDSAELKARIAGRLRKIEQRKVEADILRRGELEIQKSTQGVKAFDGRGYQDIDLTPIEFRLLLFLAQDINKVHLREELLKVVWGENIHVHSRSVDTHVSKLRKKLGSKADYIESVHGRGYRFSATEEALQIRRTELADHLSHGLHHAGAIG